LLLPRGTQWDLAHEPAPHGPYVARVLTFTRALVREAAALYPIESARVVRGAAVTTVEVELADTFARAARALADADTSRTLQRHRLLEVLLLLAECGLRFDTGNEVGWDERLRQMIAQRPHESWTIDALARAFHTSASTLRRRIADSGITLGELVREVRLETALVLLQSSMLQVGDIAARCGYESHSRFSAAFRNRFGLTPSELRPELPHKLNSEAHALARTG
jgi:AraC-like DNA-binding protein